MIERYALPAMSHIWTQQRKYETWFQVELAVCEVLARMGKVPKGVPGYLRRTVKINPTRIAEIEKITKHDVIAFLESIAEQAGEKARHIHTGLTSSDVIDTALALQMVEAGQLILEDLEALLEVLKRRAFEHQETIMVGRSHGIHGEPISLGFKFTIWYEEFKRQRDRIVTVAEDVAVGKISGAMGTFAHLSPAVEKSVCLKLGLKPAPVSNQIIQRDRHAAFLTSLAIVASSIEKVATEIRHLQRTEVLEAEEYFSVGQKGSSAMPHKRNPVGSENLCGLARVVRSNSLAAMENVALWHERDISHSSVERIIIPDSTILTNYMLGRLTTILDRLVVYPKNMLKNLELTGGLVYSQRLLLALIDRGAERKTAYEAVQRNAMETWQGRGAFQVLVSEDKFIRERLKLSEITSCFEPKSYVRHLPQVYRRVFGPSTVAATAKRKLPTKGAPTRRARSQKPKPPSHSSNRR